MKIKKQKQSRLSVRTTEHVTKFFKKNFFFFFEFLFTKTTFAFHLKGSRTMLLTRQLTKLTRQLLIGSSNKQPNSSQLYSTIYALSSGLNSPQNQSKQGVAIAVLRISGPETKRVLNSLTNGQFHRFEPRQARLTNLYNKHRNNDLIDKAIAIWFPKVSLLKLLICSISILGSGDLRID